MLEIGRVSPNTIRIFDTQLSNGLLVKKSNIKFMIDALTEIQESIDKEEQEKQAQERKVNRAMERLEMIANNHNYTIVDSKEHFILIDLDEVANSEVLTLEEIIIRFTKIYIDKLVVPSQSMSFEDYTNNSKACRIIDELKEIEKILINKH